MFRTQVTRKVHKAKMGSVADRIHRWFVAVSAFIVMIISSGIPNGLVVLFRAIQDEFNDTRTNTAAVLSLVTGFSQASGFLAGVIVHRGGPKYAGLIGGVLLSLGFLVSSFASSVFFLQISCSFLPGVGMACIFVSANFVIVDHFDEPRLRFRCLAANSACAGIGTLRYTYLLSYLPRVFTIRGSFLILCGMSMNCIPLALLWSPPGNKDSRPSNTDDNRDVSGSKEPTVKDIFIGLWQNKVFMLFCPGISLIIPAFNGCLTLLVDILQSNGMSYEDSVLVLLIFNVMTIPGRLSVGLLKERLRSSSIWIPLVNSLVGAGAMMALTFVNNIYNSIAVCSCLGYVFGVSIASMAVVTADVINDANRFSTGLGIALGIRGVLTAVEAPVYAYFRDATGSYLAPVLFSAGTVLLGCLLLLAAVVVRGRSKRRTGVYAVSNIEIYVTTLPDTS